MKGPIIVSANEVTSSLLSGRHDVKRALKISFSEIKNIIRDFGDPDRALVIDGKEFKGQDKLGPAATLALESKMEQLQSKSTSMLGIFDAMYKLERKLTQG